MHYQYKSACFTRTRVQILTSEALRASEVTTAAKAEAKALSEQPTEAKVPAATAAATVLSEQPTEAKVLASVKTEANKRNSHTGGGRGGGVAVDARRPAAIDARDPLRVAEASDGEKLCKAAAQVRLANCLSNCSSLPLEQRGS